MFETLGISATSFIAGYVASLLSLYMAGYFGWWRSFELNAVVARTFFAIAVFCSVSAASFIMLI